MVDLVIQLPVSLSLSLLFFSAAAHKVRHRERFRATLAAYRLLPTASVAPAASGLAVCEVLVGTGLLVPALWPVAGTAAAGLLIAYTLAMGINLLRGRSFIDCGCGDTPLRLSTGLLLRNAVLAGGALVLLAPTVSRPVGWFDFLTVAMAFGAMSLIYTAVAQLNANASKLNQWRENA